MERCSRSFHTNLHLWQDEGNDGGDSQPESSVPQEESLPETESQQFDKKIEKITAGKTEKELDEEFEKMIEEYGDKVDEEDDEKILPNVREYQSKQDDYTCLMPRDLSSKIVDQI